MIENANETGYVAIENGFEAVKGELQISNAQLVAVKADLRLARESMWYSPTEVNR